MHQQFTAQGRQTRSGVNAFFFGGGRGYLEANWHEVTPFCPVFSSPAGLTPLKIRASTGTCQRRANQLLPEAAKRRRKKVSDTMLIPGRNVKKKSERSDRKNGNTIGVKYNDRDRVKGVLKLFSRKLFHERPWHRFSRCCAKKSTKILTTTR